MWHSQFGTIWHVCRGRLQFCPDLCLAGSICRQWLHPIIPLGLDCEFKQLCDCTKPHFLMRCLLNCSASKVEIQAYCRFCWQLLCFDVLKIVQSGPGASVPTVVAYWTQVRVVCLGNRS